MWVRHGELRTICCKVSEPALKIFVTCNIDRFFKSGCNLGLLSCLKPCGIANLALKAGSGSGSKTFLGTGVKVFGFGNNGPWGWLGVPGCGGPMSVRQVLVRPSWTKLNSKSRMPVAPTTTEQRLARKNKLKARGTLLMALPDKHQLKFNTHKDAKTLMDAIEKRFRGSSSESLDQIHDRLQKLISQLEILGVSLSQEDINLKFLKSLLSEWRTHTLIWRNKIDLDEQSLDYLFNSLKIYEAEVKSSSSASTTT
nr:hypothetical protein [Tanacetum cinerariifolium]